MENICAAILAGGLGTRLRPALDGTPKVLARVASRPFIANLLERLESVGIEKTVLLTGYQADHVSRTLGDYYGAMTLDYSVETTQMGTGGALRHALPNLQTDAILLLNGDSFCDVNLHWLVAEHRRCRADISLTLAHVSDAGRFGKVEMTPEGILTRFVEKQAASGAGWINAGVYVLERSLVEKIPHGRNISLEQELLPIWVQRRRVYGFRCEGRFLDIGTPESYAAAPGFFAGSSPHPRREHHAVT